MLNDATMSTSHATNIVLLLKKGESLLEENRFSEATSAFENVLRDSPQNSAALCGMAEACFALGDRSAARHYIGQAIENNPDDPRTLNNAGVMLFHDKEYENAAQFLKKSILINPDYADAHFNLCATFGRLTLSNQKQSIMVDQLLPSLRWISDRAADPSRNESLDLNRQLRSRLLDEYRGKYEKLGMRVLLHSPTSAMGALFYIFESWRECLAFMGIESNLCLVGDPVMEAVESFQPNVLISVDTPDVGGKVDWPAIYEYLNRNQLRIGLCSDFHTKPRPAEFYITFHLDPSTDETLSKVSEPLLSIPFAFNPLIHRMHPARALFDFAFVGTNSPVKHQETLDYIVPLVRKHVGILAGTGWPGRFGNCNQADAGLLYSFASICPNYHLRAQLDSYSEVNERTHVLQACGAFQLSDSPRALRNLYTDDELVATNSPVEFHERFDYYLQYPEERTAIVRRGMKRAWENYSQFHMLNRLVEFLARK